MYSVCPTNNIGCSFNLWINLKNGPLLAIHILPKSLFSCAFVCGFDIFLVLPAAAQWKGVENCLMPLANAVLVETRLKS